ncbi:alpha/beta hydrolase family protein [Nonomuraea wenchangensis]|uniref:Prolyl oligopeptidase family protein n=1 Tax=Nonomuraea wenchangensis TaxID=568860 RepID=A0A1I0LNS7_9ACTN|nr:alpha/beta fold hydrolase [Nonomuraea wenchangensis]SEU43130.1 Prolyl oligopeptidase family protein [Nonomuraea wenchangensis]
MSPLPTTPTGLPIELRRINFRFSATGDHAACLTAHGRARLMPELWDLTGPAPRPRLVPTKDGEDSWTFPLPFPLPADDVGVLLCRHGKQSARLLLAVPGTEGAPAEEHELFASRRPGLGLIGGIAPGTAALLFENGEGRRTKVWRVSGHAEPLEPVAELTGAAGGGVWLDADGRRLALARPEPGAGGTFVLDLVTGLSAPLEGLADGEHLLMAAPRTGVLLTAARRDGAFRLGVRHRDDPAPTAFPERLNRIEGSVTPLTLDPGGRHLALSVTRRSRSHLLLHDLVADTTVEAELPAGTLQPTARWTTGGLHLLHTTPDRPLGVVTLPDPLRSRARATAEEHPGRWTSARTVDYPGPAGPVEAVVYGDPVASERVVLALHGGPEAAWHFGFEPLFQRMAAAGMAVVAPNQRGSTSYGAAHRDAIRGAWGGPDLADILHLGRTLADARGPGRRRPMLYGISYGAYLALLAVAAEPDLWARAAVIAPFLSGRELYRDGPPSVRALLDRLGGQVELDDDLGPRDLARLADRMRPPIMIVHGEQDPIIPVTHSRRLHSRLLAAAHPVAPVYLEIPGSDHDPLVSSEGHLVADRLIDFLNERAAPTAGPLALLRDGTSVPA